METSGAEATEGSRPEVTERSRADASRGARAEAAAESSTDATEGSRPGAEGFVHIEPPIARDDISKVKAALLRYRVMAYVVGVLLVLLVLVAMPLKYVWGDDRWVTWLGIPHGWLYMGLLITAWDLGRRVKWSLRNLIGIGLAGTIPFLSFAAEYIARKDVARKLAASNPDVIR